MAVRNLRKPPQSFVTLQQFGNVVLGVRKILFAKWAVDSRILFIFFCEKISPLKPSEKLSH